MSLMLTLALVALDTAVLATAVPTIVAELGDFALFPWLFSAYLLAQAVTTPIYAKTADVLGRKPVVLFGIGVFLFGSILCVAAWSMPALIIARAIQGVGAGAVQPIAITIVGDIYSLTERARVQGYLASTWAASSVVGPTLGGSFAEMGIWRGVFVINVPLCLIAAWMISRRYHENVARREHHVHYLGAVLLMVSLTLLVLGILGGGHAWAWDSAVSIGVFTAGAVVLGLFCLAERRAAEPILPGWVLTRRLLLTTTIVGLGVGAILIGLTSFVPTYLEGSLGVSPVVAGLALTTLTIGWPLTAGLAGRFYLRVGFKNTALIGMSLVIAGAAGLVAMVHRPNVAVIAVLCFVIGCGLGLSALPSLIAAQSSVEWDERGVVTGGHMFARALGSAVGVAVFGAIANAILGDGDVHSLGPAAIQSGTGAVFIGVLTVAVITAVAVIAMPPTPLQREADHTARSNT